MIKDDETYLLIEVYRTFLNLEFVGCWWWIVLITAQIKRQSIILLVYHTLGIASGGG